MRLDMDMCNSLKGRKNMTQTRLFIILLISMICFCGCKKTEHIEIEYGKTFELINGTLSSYDGVTWSSNNENVVSIEDGKTISAKEPGSATVSGMKNNKAVIDYNVDVILVPIEKIELSEVEAEMNVGDTKTLKYKLSPDNASDYGVKWVSEDETVVTVNENGTIKAVNAGTAYVKAISDKGIESSNFKAVVKDHPDFPDPKEYGFDVAYGEVTPSKEVKKTGLDKHIGKTIFSCWKYRDIGDNLSVDDAYTLILSQNGFEYERVFDSDLVMDEDLNGAFYTLYFVYWNQKPVATLEEAYSMSITNRWGNHISYTLREYKE